MGHFYYGRHFCALAAAVVVLFLLSRWKLFGESLLPTFAISGALHASALAFVARASPTLMRKCLFIALAAGLSVVTLYIGILGFQLFAVLPANERLYMVLVLCAASGAITYGWVMRLFWMPKLSSRSVLAMAIACVFAALLAFFVRGYFQFLEGSWIAAAWWFAFSGALWYVDTHHDSRTRT
jgi:hypothetical protein